MPGTQRASRLPFRRASPHETTLGGAGIGLWLVQGTVAAAIVLLASGAFLPWIRVTGSLSRELEPLVRGMIDLAAQFLGTEVFREFRVELTGLDWHGPLTLGIALISLVVLIVDLFSYRRSMVPGIIYLLSGILVTAAVIFDLANFYRLYSQARALSLLFGIKVEQIFDVFDYFIDIEPTLMSGLWLTLAGLGLLLVGGVARLAVGLLEPN
jgi:hypothetical protein